MIHWYKFNNFYSYRDEITVDMRLKKNSSETDYDFHSNGKRISKILAVMGGNGAGKSNLLRPLAFLGWFCSNSFKDQEEYDALPLYPYKLNDDKPTIIEICFSLPINIGDKYLFKYYVSLNNRNILKEELKVKNHNDSHYLTLFKRKMVNGKYKITVDKEHDNDDDFPSDEIKLIPNNISIISYLNRKKVDLPRAIGSFFASIHSNLNVHGKNTFNYRKVLQVANKYHEDKEIFNMAVRLIKDMDFGIEDIKLSEEEFMQSDSGEVSKKIIPYGIHKSGNDSFEVPFISESSGTQALFSFALPLLCALKVGGVAVMDEIDSDLHPLMVLSILSLFEDENINKYNAQLIFSCHTPEILKILKKHHVYLVEKVDSASEAWRMDDIVGLRSQDNLYSKYMTGALGGVPDILL